MSEKQVTIKVSVQDNFSTQLDAYQKKMAAAATSTKDIGGAAKEGKSSLEQLNGVMKIAVGLFAAKAAFGFLEDLTQLGQQSIATKAVFSALVGDTENVADAMKILNDATGGVVSNMDLMQSSSKLFQMGLADTSTEAAKLIDMAVSLGAAFNMEAGAAVENFTLMLANQSILRLDSYGISATKVKERMKELQGGVNGLAKDAAFMQAVLEIGGDAMEDLGDAANASVTPLAAAQKKIEDFKASVGEFATVGVGNFFSLWGQGVEILEAANDKLGRFLGMDTEFNNYITLLKTAYNTTKEFMDSTDLSGKTGDYHMPLFEDIKAVYELMQQHPDMAFLDVLKNFGSELDPELLMKIVSNLDEWRPIIVTFNKELEKTAEQMQGLIDATGGIANSIKNLNLIENQRMATSEAIKQNYIDQAAAAEQMKGYWEFIQTMQEGFALGQEMVKDPNYQFQTQDLAALHAYSEELHSQLDTLRELHEEGLITDEDLANQERVVANFDDMVTALDAMGQSAGLESLKTFDKLAEQAFGHFDKDTIRDFAGIEIVSPETAARVEATLVQMDAQLETMREMHELGLITDEDLSAAEGMRDRVSDLADQAERAANAINSMNLDQLLGRTDGGVLGELGDKVVAGMEAGGASASQIAAFSGTMNLESGRDTEFSNYFDNTLTPVLTKLAEQDPEAAVAAIDRVEAAIKEGRALGMSDAELSDYVGKQAGYQFAPRDYSVGNGYSAATFADPGLQAVPGGVMDWTTGGIAAEFGAKMGGKRGRDAGFKSPYGEQTGYYGGYDYGTGGDDTALLEEKKDAVGNEAGDLGDAFEQAKSSLDDLKTDLDDLTSQEFKVLLNIDAIMSPELKLLLSGAGKDIGSTVRDNGGTVPGGDRRGKAATSPFAGGSR